MRKSLFALENNDDMGVGSEMEVGMEEGEVAAVMTDGAEDAAEINEISDAVSEGTEAADQMGQVEELVGDAVENGEGLDPVAAEAVRISVEAICARVGANPKAVYSLYATENFQSASSRKANSRIALEGVGQFLKDLWERIKASLKTLWEKVKAFFDKHVSSLGRVKKALDAAKAKVSASSGKFKAQGSIDEAPSALVNAFAGKTPISTGVISKFIVAHTAAGKEVGELLDTKAIPTFTDGKLSVTVKLNSVQIGTAAAPLIGGKYTSVKFGEDGGDTTGEDAFEFEVTRETIDKESKLGVNLANKDTLQATIKETLTLINATVKFKEKFAKASSDYNKALNDIGAAIAKLESDASADAAVTKASRNALNFFYKVNAKVPSLAAEQMSADISLAKAVLGYTSLCLKNYK